MALSSNNAHHKGEVLVDVSAMADEDMRQKHRPRYASAPVMRALLTIGLLILVVTVLVLSWDTGDGVVSPPVGYQADAPTVEGSLGNDSATSEQATRLSAGGLARIAQLPSGVVATRTEPAKIDPVGLSDRATACLRVIDHISEQPVAGAVVRSLRNGADIAFTDGQGLAALPVASAVQMAVVSEGYLLRLAPVRLGSTEAEPQVVRLVADQWSLRRRFAFVDPDGQRLTEVFVRIKPVGKRSESRMPVPPDDDIVRRAWSEHTMLATREVSRDVAIQLGSESVDRVLRLTNDMPIIRFAMPGDFLLEAATTTGLVARAEVAVILGSEPPPQLVRMKTGALVSGLVTDLAGVALERAEITIQGSGPLGLRATTATDGSFTVGPLPIGSATLLVRHGTHVAISHGPVPVPAQDVLIQLAELSRRPLKGRVRARPNHQPIADALVVWQITGGAAITAKTAVDGTFELQAAGEIACKLRVQAPGYVGYVELVEPDAGFANYDVWPADLATRIDQGVTASLEGLVFDPDGEPVANTSVRWMPDNPSGSTTLPGRLVLEGAMLQMPGVAVTDSSGAFVIETNQFGRGRLLLVSDGTKNVVATAIAGQSKKGFELRQ